MILHLGAQSSELSQVIATTALIVHIGGGGIGLMTGAAALVVRKGGKVHRLVGNVFVVSMLLMSAVGMAVAPLLPQRSSVLAAALTFYLVLTGWMAFSRKNRTAALPEYGALIFALFAVSVGVMFGWQAMQSPTGLLDGDDPPSFFVFAALTAFAAAWDIRVIARGGVVGRGRTARHLWRMCTALLIAAVSFFLGQEKVFPTALRGSPLLITPELAVIAAMVFWLIQVRLFKLKRFAAI